MITSQLEVAESELNASRKQLGQWERDKPFAFQPPDATLESNITILRKLLDDLKPKLAEAEALQKQVHASAKLIEQVDGDGDIKMEAPPPPLAGFSKRKRASSPSTALVAGHVAKLQSEYDKLAQQVAYVERNVEVEEEEMVEMAREYFKEQAGVESSMNDLDTTIDKIHGQLDFQLAKCPADIIAENNRIDAEWETLTKEQDYQEAELQKVCVSL